MCVDVQDSDQLRTEWHHDHEIEYVRELYAGDSQQEQAFVLDERRWGDGLQKSLPVKILLVRAILLISRFNLELNLADNSI